jgi:hypothetical protein
MRLEGQVARMGQRRGVYGVLVRKPKGKRPLVRPRHRWEDNIKVDLQEIVTRFTGLQLLSNSTAHIT